MDHIYQELKEILPEASVRCGEPMAKHTTFRIGGPARYYVTPDTEEQLIRIVDLCRKEAVCWYVTGNGSNLLVKDEGYDGLILSTEGLSRFETKGEIIQASAGVLLSRLAKEAAANSLTGFEFAAGIPGSLGGAVVMNAGAYGAEMKDCLEWAKVLDSNGQVKIVDASQLKLGYRSSCIPAEHYVVLQAAIRLSKGDSQEIGRKMEELAAKRKEKQPLEYPSAGSTFKRPEGYFAGKLIDEAGFRGYGIGGAQVSEKHCGFVINRGGATAAEVLTLCGEIERRVREQFGVELELEMKLL